MARGKKKESTLTPEEKLAQALVPVEEQPYTVPGNWSWVRLGSFSTNQYGYTAKAIDSNDLPKMLRITDIQDSGVDWNTVPNCEIAETDLEKYLLKSNDIVIARIGATTGKSYLLKNPVNAVFASYLIRLRFSESFLPAYVYYFLQSDTYWKQISELSSGTALPGVNSSKLQSMMFPAAPRFEQQRIVDRIEYLFAKLDEAKEKAQSVLDSFETRKAAILHKAFTGELTAKWRAEHGMENGKASEEQGLFLLPIQWTWSEIGNLVEICLGLTHTPTYVDSGVPFLSVKNITSGYVDFDDTKYISRDEYASLPYGAKPQKGDLLFARVGTIGKPQILSTDIEFGIFVSLGFFRFSRSTINSKYVQHWMNSHIFDRQVSQHVKGSTLKNLNTGWLKHFLIPVPPQEEQLEIVRILDNLFAKEQQAKEAAEAVLEKIDLLKKSILARAFRGELGTNDPTEESALELLKTVL